MNYAYSDIAKMIDHSLLNPSLTDEQMEDGCRLAVQATLQIIRLSSQFDACHIFQTNNGSIRLGPNDNVFKLVGVHEPALRPDCVCKFLSGWKRLPS